MVSEFIGALLFNPFLFAAFLAASAVSVAGGIVGSYVVVKRIVFISGSISHCVLGGMGFFLWLQRVHGIEWAYPTLGALVAALIAALLVGWIHLFYREREDTVIAAVWAIGMSLGIVFISQTPGYNVELT
ncbi:MAG: metal ABC transporter permease, partial [Chlamydiia bacterium]|nr:metal ABC transporter permease [Chlamydiia bacterium]